VLVKLVGLQEANRFCVNDRVVVRGHVQSSPMCVCVQPSVSIALERLFVWQAGSRQLHKAPNHQAPRQSEACRSPLAL
jgi:hypothetical protein